MSRLNETAAETRARCLEEARDFLSKTSKHYDFNLINKLSELLFNKENSLICPFCEEGDFDLRGLEDHISRYCMSARQRMQNLLCT